MQYLQQIPILEEKVSFHKLFYMIKPASPRKLARNLGFKLQLQPSAFTTAAKNCNNYIETKSKSFIQTF